MSRSAEHEARNTALRSSFSSRAETKASLRPDAEVIPAQAQQLGLSHSVETVPASDGAKLHWLGNRSAGRVILYFHGGGYGLPILDGHVVFLEQCTQRLAHCGHDTLIAILEYGLTEAKKYPTQLLQATEALRMILAQGIKPSNLIVGGDSCGGNLCMGLLSHIVHPLKGVKPLSLEEPLAGLLLISAWLSFRSDSTSYSRNETKDMHKKEHMHEWAADFVLESERNNWSEPIRADVSWWEGLPVKEILNIWGTYELFADDITLFGKTLERAGANVRNVECPMHVHIDCVLDAHTGLEPGLMSTEIWKWLEKLF